MPLGWDEHFAFALAAHRGPGDAVGRVVVEHRIDCEVVSTFGEARAAIPGRLWRAIERGEELKPTVGDWVVLSAQGAGKALLTAVLPRRSWLSRKAAGRAIQQQIGAANVDTVFVVSALNQPPRPRLLERFVAMAKEGGAEPVILLSKADLCGEARTAQELAEHAAPGVGVHVISAVSGLGLGALATYLLPTRTAVFVGASGVGKSTLVNLLLGEEQLAVGGLGAQGKGKHTTTRRELLVLPSGSIVIDTPGIRELGMWDAQQGVAEAFSDIDVLAQQCRFADCKHEEEPDCAVKAAVNGGQLLRERYSGWKKLQRELRERTSHQNRRNRKSARR